MELEAGEKPGLREKNAAVQDIRMVVGAAAAGTVFEWYDFYIYGSILAVNIKIIPFENRACCRRTDNHADVLHCGILLA